MTSNHNRAGAGSMHRRAAQNQLKGAKTKEDYKKAAETGITGQIIAEYEAAEAKDDLAYERQKHSPYKEWGQMNFSWDIFYRVMTLVDKPYGSTAMKVFLFMFKMCDNTDALIIGVKTIADCLGLSKETVNKAIKTLKNNKLLYSVKAGSSTIYLLNAEAVYKGYGKHHGLCQFRSSVVLSAEEAAAVKKIKKQVVNKPTKTVYVMNENSDDGLDEVPVEMPWDTELVEDTEDEKKDE